MKFLSDLFPVILFFIAYKMYDFYVATAVIIVATIAQVGFNWFRHHKVEKMHLVTLLLVLLFGGLTLYLQDPLFLKWKPTVVNWLFAIVFLGSQFIGNKPLVERMMSKSVALPPPVWSRLNLAWTLFFVAMGVVNLYVAFNFSEAAWVNFKLFGMMGMTILFIILQAFYLAKFITEPEQKTTPEES
ncbi:MULTISPECIES: septation protein A [Sedimenticola]|uniref:Inner membrane-spanning protein YciB n=1 Tax=Sedimenticola selenatireducens TaxID=191960 RepID=A0A2N6CYE7_9GAMM|nr:MULTISPECIES: septation protein A [Sedimenticola]MCW8903658.1 septation protein A [Sedimenticola sp.]PLX62385.1 MAG: septation protein A [Sedimenticola selenatireducens]